MPIGGVVGSLMWGYYVAAAVNGYTVARRGRTVTLRGTVVLRNAYNLAQRPLYFVAPHSKGEWRWIVGRFTVDDAGALEAILEPIGAVVQGDRGVPWVTLSGRSSSG